MRKNFLSKKCSSTQALRPFLWTAHCIVQTNILRKYYLHMSRYMHVQIPVGYEDRGNAVVITFNIYGNNYVTQNMLRNNASFTSKRRHDLATLEVLDGGEYSNFTEYLHVSLFKLKNRGLFPENDKRFCFLLRHCTQLPIRRALGTLSPPVKQPGRESDHLTRSQCRG